MDVIWVRETEAGGCRSCGRDLSQWERGIPIRDALVAIGRDPALLEALFVRRCPGCGAPYDWDVVVFEDDPDEPEADSRRDATRARIAAELQRGTDLADIANELRRDLGVEGIFVEDAPAEAGPKGDPGRR